MHAHEVTTDAVLVRRLLAAQFPAWADLPVEPVDSHGTVNAIYRLGADMAVRLPRVEGGSKDVATEHHWLPRLAPHLPYAVPEPLAHGTPTDDYPWSWSVCRWLEGDNPAAGAGTAELAADLAAFVTALRKIDVTNGPPAYRSEALPARDTDTRAALATLRGVVDTAAATEAWTEALRAPGPPAPTWVHGDLQPGNVLLSDGRLTGVIDFGCMGVADPAVDLIAGWYLLPARTRQVFRTQTAADDAAWARGRGWALSIALMELSYYRTTNPVMASTARHVIEETLEDGRRRARGAGGGVRSPG
ncbi:aminoglycoside phosphotransferase family protein [Streptomyces sp. B1I3]|uniref:aminoglycoside phosphotransferase family protein n=1 Tax=Streptomyces sp. B1I3 TaxID=3042264 RepID=UPI0027851AFE|nr:aminoglycoside phosphotransferase family protein [Streptomyces sp. B1I3]MDQ0795828.1 aminoglycoside phosphotransferase (APT) family kinase protein [Streptomyces sp. B1I3]